jgi:glutamyl-tRNA reductase
MGAKTGSPNGMAGAAPVLTSQRMIAAPIRAPAAPRLDPLAPVAIGVDHRAPIALRERLAAAAPALAERLAGAGDEAALLSTCNRTELYVVGPASRSVVPRLAEAGLTEAELAGWLWVREGAAAATHLFEVAAGLDSQLLGETEILRQVRAAQAAAHANGTGGPVLAALFRHALAVGKRARARTEISRGAASVGSAAAAIVRAELPAGERRHAVVVGAGDAAARVLAHLRPLGFGRVDVVNRTVERAERLLERAGPGSRALGLDALPGLLGEADAVLCATSAPEPVVTLREAAAAPRAGRGRRLLLLDLAVPRDVEPAVADLPGVTLYDIDAVQARAAADVERRGAAAGHARALVRAEVEAFERWLTARRAAPPIARLRATAEASRQRQLADTFGELSDAERARVERASRATMRRLLHAPTVALRRGEQPDLTALTAAGFLP